MDPPTVVETAYGTTYKNFKRSFAAPLPVAAFEEPSVPDGREQETGRRGLEQVQK